MYLMEDRFKDKMATRLKLAREDAGLTQNEVADHLGMARSTYANLETGRNFVSVEHLAKLPAILHRKVEYFLGLDDLADRTPIKAIVDILIHLDELELKNVYDYVQWRFTEQSRRPDSSGGIQNVKGREGGGKKSDDTVALIDLMEAVVNASPQERLNFMRLLAELAEQLPADALSVEIDRYLIPRDEPRQAG